MARSVGEGRNTTGRDARGRGFLPLLQFRQWRCDERTRCYVPWKRIVRAATLNSDSVEECVPWQRMCIGLQCANKRMQWFGSQYLDCSVIGFCIFPTIKLGMHKMELGDSVYAAERIMKKRIRKVSFISLQNIAVTDSNLAKLACEITYQWRVWLVRFICKLLVSQHANAWLFMLAPNIKTCFYNALYKMLRMNVVYILWINPSIVRWRQLFRNYRKGFVFLFMRVFRSLLLLRVPLHKSCVKTGGHSEKLNKFLYNRCPSLDKFLTVNKFGRTVWGVTLPYCNVHFFTIFFESCPVTNLIPTLITINFAFGFSFLFALS